MRTMVVVLSVLLMAASAQAAAIGINVSNSSTGNVTGPAGDVGSVQSNWNNGTGGGGLVNNTGAAVPGMSYGLNLNWGGGWSYYTAVAETSNPVNTLGRVGWEAQYGPVMNITGIPYASYTVKSLWGDYGGGNLTWYTNANQSGANWTTPSYRNGGGALYAVQIIDPAGVPEPATMSILALGGAAALIRRRNRR